MIYMFKKIITSLLLLFISNALYALTTINVIVRNESEHEIPNFHIGEDGSQYIVPVMPLPLTIQPGTHRYTFRVEPSSEERPPMMSLLAGDIEPPNGFELSVRLGEYMQVSCISQGDSKISYYSYSMDSEELTIRFTLD